MRSRTLDPEIAPPKIKLKNVDLPGSARIEDRSVDDPRADHVDEGVALLSGGRCGEERKKRSEPG